jgi:hypothetical protein
MAHAGEEDAREWEILLSREVESFLDDLYESDPASHQLVTRRSSSWNAMARGGQRSCRWPGTSQDSGASGTGRRFPARSGRTTITLPSAGRRLGHE